jgi:UDP-N-acetylglucosamine acyltransferase
MPQVHPTASVSREAILADDVQIGPMCVLDGPVRLAPGVRLIGNVYIQGPASIGENTILYPFACIGFPPQDYKFKPGDRTAGVVIGRDCLIREHATVHAASNDHTPTSIGDKVFMMANSHIAHDCRVGNSVIMVNNCAIAGHSQLGDNVTLSAAALVHQFNRVGRLGFVSGASALTNEMPPFCVAWGRNQMIGINLVGLRRSGMPREHITLIRRAYREAFRSRVPKAEALAILRQIGSECPPVMEMADFVATARRAIVDALPRGSDDADLT